MRTTGIRSSAATVSIARRSQARPTLPVLPATPRQPFSNPLPHVFVTTKIGTAVVPDAPPRRLSPDAQMHACIRNTRGNCRKIKWVAACRRRSFCKKCRSMSRNPLALRQRLALRHLCCILSGGQRAPRNPWACAPGSPSHDQKSGISPSSTQFTRFLMMPTWRASSACGGRSAATGQLFWLRMV